jgi:hypothetical protein
MAPMSSRSLSNASIDMDARDFDLAIGKGLLGEKSGEYRPM